MSANTISIMKGIPHVPQNPPTRIYWDTSFILISLIGYKRDDIRALPCKTFARYLLNPKLNNCSNETSDYAINEVLFKRISSRAWKAWMDAGGEKVSENWSTWLKGQSGFINSLQSSIQLDYSKLQLLHIIRCDSGFDLSGNALKIIHQHELLPTDAYQITIAKNKGITTFVSVDCDFEKLDGCNVYCCKKK